MQCLVRRRGRGDVTTPRARITWVPADRLHLTVRFIGEVGDAQAEQIMRVLREPLATAPFAIALDRLGAFPPSGPPRVFWIGISAGHDAMLGVEAEISARLATVGVAPEARPYSPHVTLARVRESAGLRPTTLFDRCEPAAAETRVRTVTLFQSKLSPKGASYVTVLQTPLVR